VWFTGVGLVWQVITRKYKTKNETNALGSRQQTGGTPTTTTHRDNAVQ
jgi:hypothetical protein